MSGLTFNYSEDVQKRVGEIIAGIKVQTPVLSTLATYWTNPVTYAVFNVVGLIKVVAMYLEVTSAFDANATTLVFRWTGTTPALAIATMGSASASIATSAAGVRVMFTGTGQVAAGPIAGISYLPATYFIGGQTSAGVNCTGVISALVAGGTQAATASGRYALHYVPMTEGAYAVSAI
jgi:hypothetical protein